MDKLALTVTSVTLVANNAQTGSVLILKTADKVVLATMSVQATTATEAPAK